MFAFGLLQPGEYQIEASVEGMSGRESVRVEVGASVQVVLRLVIRNQQQVTVSEAPQVVETQRIPSMSSKVRRRAFITV